jgi:NitT/TauT family transport system substrate-binding protein
LHWPWAHFQARTFWLLLLLSSLAVGCGSPEPAPRAVETETDERLEPVTIQLNWYPEAEHGGVYQALADGTYAEHGLDVRIRPGGRAITVAPELELGRCQFAITNADDVVIYRREGSDIVAVLAAVQDHPRCILVRADSGVKTFEDLAGMTLQRQPGRMFLEYMRARGLLDQVREVSYNGIAGLVNDEGVAIQAYSFAEPLQAEQAGVETKRLMVSELGWNPYSSVLVTTGELIREEPDLVRRVVEATRTGWQNYLTDPTLGNEAILAANDYGMTAEALDFGAVEMRDLALPGDAPIETVGSMTLDRWQTLVDQIVELDPETAGKVKAEACFTTEFLP